MTSTSPSAPISVHSPLAPHIAVEYWRNTQVGLQRVGFGQVPHFAILRVGKAADDATRFDLPAQADQFNIVLRAIAAAYSLGHHDRQNRILRLVGLAPIAEVVPCIRTAEDREI
jgi:hypothetical protein